MFMIIKYTQNNTMCPFSRYRKAHSVFPQAQYPSLIWDVLPKCGASQVHPHMHGFLDSRQYHGMYPLVFQ